MATGSGRGDEGRVSRRRLFGLGLGAAGGAAAGAFADRRDVASLLRQIELDLPPLADLAPATRIAPPAPARVWSTESIGTSAHGRSIGVWRSASPASEAARVMVIAGVHGNERATWPLADRISRQPLPSDVSIWIVPSANPDGWVASSRRNAHGVDLNRNFPWRWSPTDGGPSPASAPETSALMHAVASVRPHLAIWIHQPLAYVAALGSTPVGLAQAWANEVGDRVRTDVDQHGGGETWTNRVLGVPSILVEARGWTLTPAQIEAHARGFTRCIDHLRANR